jgi:multidrug resistance efflux pump
MRYRICDYGILAAFVLLTSSHLAQSQDSQTEIEKRLGELEQRVDRLERRLVVTPELTKAESRLAAAREKLEHTERLYKKGYVSELQVEADRLAVAKARQELQLAKADRTRRHALLEIDVLQAEHKLAIATERLRFRERLRIKGYVTDSQVQTDKIAAERARRELERAQARLKAESSTSGEAETPDRE